MPSIGNEIPTGIIVMWSGAIANIPAGWFLCNGNNGTPNLTDRFVLHADADSSGTNNVGDTGGSFTSGATTLTTNEIPSHTHQTAAGQNGGGSNEGSQRWTGGGDAGLVSGSTGGGGSHTHTAKPKYYALAYIMKS